MKYKIIICLLFFLANQNFFGQNKTADSCNLKTKNIQWKASYEKIQSNESKLKLIREKIISDSIYSEYKPKIITQFSPSIYSEVIDKNGNDCGVKMLFILSYSKEKSIILDLNKNPEYSVIIESLNEINIQKIYPIFDKSAESLYGILAKSGVIILTSENRKFKKEIKKIVNRTKKKTERLTAVTSNLGFRLNLKLVLYQKDFAKPKV